MSKRRPEREFLTKLGHSFRENGAFFFKIPDMPHFAGVKTRFDSAKPFDAMLVWCGKPFAIEAKALNGYQSFRLSMLRDCQIKGLNAYEEAGGFSYLFINIKSASPRFNRLVILEWKSWRERLETKSIRKVELEKLPFIEMKKQRYNIGPWLHGFWRTEYPPHG